MIIVCQSCGHQNPHDTPIERFWNQVDKSGDCWVWVGAIISTGHPYGFFALNGTRVYAHRFAYEMANGPIPKGMVVCHKCDNPKCVRHDHLFLGTQADNVSDMMQKGRQPLGADCSSSKLTEQMVSDMRREHATGLHTYVELGKKYSINDNTVRRIVNGKLWKHLPLV